MGRLAVLRSSSSIGEDRARACGWIAKSLTYHLKRHEMNQLALQKQGREIILIGTSGSLSRIDHFIEQASRSPLPALVLGEPGTSLTQVALALHVVGPCCESPFVQFDCAALGGDGFEQRLLQLLLQAQGGTLLLTRLGALHPRSQLLLRQILEIGLPVWTAERCGQPLQVRLLTTANHELDAAAQRGDFSAGLLREIDFLRLEVEPLRMRREDIRPLVEFYLRRHACGEVPEVSEDALEALVEYDWPGNTAELSRMMARLAVMTEEGCVLPRHISAYAPQVLQRPEVQSSPGAEKVAPDAQPAGDFLAQLETCHISLQRAVHYISANFQRKISLSEVASHSHVSSSHLAHLFQEGLGTTFTRFLSVVRLTHAKKLLLEGPRETITTIASEAGFSDFRHFERTFKAIVGCTPREYRRLSNTGSSESRGQSTPH